MADDGRDGGGGGAEAAPLGQQCPVCQELSPDGERTPCCNRFVCQACADGYGRNAFVRFLDGGVACCAYCDVRVADRIGDWRALDAYPQMAALLNGLEAAAQQPVVVAVAPAVDLVEAAWAATFPCSNALCNELLPIDAANDCDVVLCRTCNHQTNVVDPNSNAHSFLLRELLGNMNEAYDVGTDMMTRVANNLDAFRATRLQLAALRAIVAGAANQGGEVARIAGQVRLGGFETYAGYVEHLAARVANDRPLYAACAGAQDLAALVAALEAGAHADTEAVRALGPVAAWPAFSADSAGTAWALTDPVITNILFSRLLEPGVN